MIKRIISLKYNAGKAQEARQYAQEVNDFINKKHAKISSEVYVGKYGDLGTIHFIAQFDNIGQMDEAMAATSADEKYQAMATKAIGLFIEGSAKMSLMETF